MWRSWTAALTTGLNDAAQDITAGTAQRVSTGSLLNISLYRTVGIFGKVTLHFVLDLAICNCQHGGTCVAPGVCRCPNGYSGNSCEKRKWRSKFFFKDLFS